jgi:hypothetical protein
MEVEFNSICNTIDNALEEDWWGSNETCFLYPYEYLQLLKI